MKEINLSTKLYKDKKYNHAFSYMLIYNRKL